jgi:flagellin-like protein
MEVPSHGPGRGVSPVISTVLLVAVVVVVGTTVAVFALGLGESTSTSPPKAALDTVKQPDNSTVIFRHQAGETIDRQQLRVRGAASVSAPEKITAGKTIAVEPESGADEVTVVWETTEQSAVLTSAPVAGGASGGGPAAVYTGANVQNLTAQCQDGSVTEADLSDPFTVEVVLNESVDKNVSLDVSARNSLGDCGTPTNTYSGNAESTFSDGVGQFTIGTSEGDLTFEPFFPGVEIEDIDAVSAAVADGSYEVVEIRIGT